jgi:hypothetical protein
MKKTYLLTALIMLGSLVLFSFATAASNTFVLSASSVVKPGTDSTATAQNKDRAAFISAALYDTLHLDSLGLSQEAVQYAVKGYEKLLEEGAVNNDQYLTIVDLSQSSRKKRFYIIDMKHDQLVWNTYVAHGRNSGVDEATSFSNSLNSEESSLGFYLTKTTYFGKHGLSLRISGQEEGFNDNAEARGIVVHGAPYVNGQRVNTGYMGRSQGCPALPENEYAKVINIIKGGSVIFIYHPSASYIQGSPLLNS